MKIINNVLYGDKVAGRENAISEDETADQYTYITSFNTNTYMKKITLSSTKRLNRYKELLLILCRKSNNEILNTTYVSEYDINKMINNYEFTNGAFELTKLDSNKDYYISLSVKNESTIYVSCNNISKGYIFGKSS